MELSKGARVEYVDLDAVAAWPRNPKRHDLPMLSASFDRFGFVAPVLVDEATGRLVAGHGRLTHCERSARRASRRRCASGSRTGGGSSP